MRNVIYGIALVPLFLVACAEDAGNRNETRADQTAARHDKDRPHEVASPGVTAPDNTANNVRERDPDALTPMDQGQNKDDVRITAEIRSAIVADQTMSMNAANIKIITSEGVTTLRGVVKTQAEKTSIESKVASVPGVVRVDNQLEINQN